MSKDDPGCLHSAGALQDGKLSENCYNRIIDDIKKAGELGFGEVSMFPCDTGTKLGPCPGLVPQDLERKDLYPEFHSDIMGTFEKVALALDVKGNMLQAIFPFWDPFAMAMKLNIEMPSFNILDLPSITPPELAAKLNLQLPDLLQLPFKLPGVPALPAIPEIPFPDYNLMVDFPPGLHARFDFNLWWTKLIDFVLQMCVPDLGIVMPLFSVPPSPCSFIEKVVQAQLFGPAEPGDLAKVIALQELATFTGQCVSIVVPSQIIGDGGPLGLTGTTGAAYGWRTATPVSSTIEDGDPRNMVRLALKNFYGVEPTLKEVQFVQAIAKAENGYGKGWIQGPNGESPPPEVRAAHNWGNVHGSGTAGSVTWYDVRIENGKDVKYSTAFARNNSEYDAALYVVKNSLGTRPYVRDAILKGKSLWEPVYLMSPEAFNKKVVPDMKVPGYYGVGPSKYFYNMQLAIYSIMGNLKEEDSQWSDVPNYTAPARWPAPEAGKTPGMPDPDKTMYTV